MKQIARAIFFALLPALTMPALLLHPAVAQTPAAVQLNSVYAGADGKFEAAPDTAVLSLNVSSQQNTAREANDKIAAAAERVRAVLRNNGLDPKAAQVGYYAVQPVYDWKNPKHKVIAFIVNTSITLKLRDFAKIGPITDQLADIEEAQNQSLSYVLDDMEQAKAKAAEDAIKKARHQASAVAVAGGRTLGDLLYASVDVTQQSIMPVPVQRMSAMATAGATPAPTAEFSPQSVIVNAHVNALFALK